MEMDHIDAIAKLILFTGITVSCLGVSIQFMRLLGAITENVKDLRKTVKNIGILTGDLVENQKLIKEGLKSFVGVGRRVEAVVSTISQRIVQPLAVISGILSSIKNVLETVTQRFVRDK